MKENVTFGVIVANRGFFPAHLVKTGHDDIQAVLKKLGYGCIVLGTRDTKYGSVESISDARKCADLFKKHAERIDGVIVTAPNFGDERSCANALRWSGLDVPVLVQAEPDDIAKMSVADRRDSFCGKVSICNVLRQYGISYSLTTNHCEAVKSPEFAADLELFAATCRVVKALRNARFGAIGARTTPFFTVRYSEKILQANGITIETMDLSEALAAAEKVESSDKDLKRKTRQVRSYVDCPGVTREAFDRMARLVLVIERWMKANDLQGTALQCWDALENIYKIVPCGIMSLMSNAGISSACEVDIGGTIAMHALRAASGRPSALVDWNNNYGDEPDKCVIFHCSNFPKDVMTCAKMSFQTIIAGAIGEENSFGAMHGRVKPSPMTFARVSTDDVRGIVRAYVGEGRFTDDPLETFGGVGVLEVCDLQLLMEYICEEGFEHHTAVNLSDTADSIHEAFEKYLGWEVYRHI